MVGAEAVVLEWAARIAVTAFGVVGTFAFGVALFMLKRIYGSLNLLFAKYDAQQDEITQLKIFLSHLAATAPGITPELYKLLLPVRAAQKSRSSRTDSHDGDDR